MTAADIERLLAENKLRQAPADPDVLRDLRNQSEYDALHVDVGQARDALEHVRVVVEAIGDDL